MSDDAVLFTQQDVIDLANGIYGEAASEDYDTMVTVGSSVINRIQANRPQEFGTNIQDVLMRGYYAVSNPNTPYQQAVAQKFPDKKSEDAYKQALAISSGLLKGTIKPKDVQFYFTKDEITKQKRKKSFNFKAVRETGKVGKYTTFSY